MSEDVHEQSSQNNWKVSATQHVEAQLWREFKSGDESAYIVIYQRYFRELYRYGLKICSDSEMVKDCIQDLFIDIWNRRAHLADTDSITFYLWAALKRRIIKVLRKTNVFNHNPSSQLLYITELDAEKTVISAEIATEQRERIVWAMQQLSKRQREAIQLKFYHNLNNEEIAQRMSIQVEAVYNLVSKALALFRKSLQCLSFIAFLLKL